MARTLLFSGQTARGAGRILGLGSSEPVKLDTITSTESKSGAAIAVFVFDPVFRVEDAAP
jgi:hypothetical protein